MYICQSYLSTEVSGRHTQSTQPDLHTQVSPRRMQSLTSRASPVSAGLTPASRSPRLAPGLSPTSVVRILTWPLMNSSSHPSVFSVEDSSLDQPVVTLKPFYVNLNVYLTNHMTPPMPSPPIMFSDKT